jgi:integrase
VRNRTLQKDRAVLHRIFALADRLEWRDGNPVGRMDPPKAEGRDPVLLTTDQYDALVAACDGGPMLRLYVLVLGEAGLRCEPEALRLQFDDVDLDRGFLWVASGRADGAGGTHRTKSGKGRWVPLTPQLKSALRDHFAAYRFAIYGAKGERSPWIFHQEVTRHRRRAGARIESLRDAFNRAAVRAELPAGFRPHDLRHRRVTTWLAEGQSAVLVKEAMGHWDLRTTMGYTHLTREHLAPLAEVRQRGNDRLRVDDVRGGTRP